MKNTASRAGQSGFTLIELSIVLVIIGLLVGGVLEGQDLIKAAQVRSVISQFEAFDASVNTFRTKYNGLPGDVANGGNFFPLTDVPNSTAGKCANAVPNNGTLDDCTDVIPARILLSGEPAAFWLQLYDANLIANPITDKALIGGSATVAAPAIIANAFPASKVGGYILAYTGGTALPQPGMPGSNLYRLAGVTAFTSAGAPTFSNSLTPLQAFQIDSKKDDGNPNTGVVQATDATAAANFNVITDTYTAGATACVTATPAYNTSTQYGNNQLCQLVIRSSF